VVHDPAKGAFQVLDRNGFTEEWTGASRWSLVVLPKNASPRSPGKAVPSSGPSRPAASPTGGPCDELVQASVERGRGGDLPAAEAGLLAARALCPQSPAPLRELAGLRFKQSRWREARDLAQSAVTRDPNDRNAWQLLGGSAFLAGDAAAALAAWNQVGEPRADVVTVHGNELTKAAVVTSLVGIQPRQILTPDVFLRAQRKLASLPAASTTQLRYEPTSDGRAIVDASIVERARVPSNWIAAASIGVRAAITRTVKGTLANLFRNGETLDLEWRWSDRRPRLAGTFTVPSVGWTHGIASVDAAWDEQTYAVSNESTIQESRREVGLHVGDWATGRLRWRTGAAFDRLNERDHLALDGDVERRLAGDLAAVVASAAWWTPGSQETPSFWTAEIRGAWRSKADADARWRATAEWLTASANAPLALWPGASTGNGRDLLLRAHPLLDADVVRGPAFGRRLVQGTAEYTKPIAARSLGRLLGAVFVDTARAWQRLDGATGAPFQADIGVGIRVRSPQWHETLRLDLATGVRDGRTVLSAGFIAAWPR
jgi:hypothetical protein